MVPLKEDRMSIGCTLISEGLTATIYQLQMNHSCPKSLQALLDFEAPPVLVMNFVPPRCGRMRLALRAGDHLSRMSTKLSS